jgi:predicted enzyme related to lactoylglutathione lyase
VPGREILMPNKPSVVVFPADDLEAATATFRTLLDTDPYAEAPYYVGFRVGDLEIGLDPHGSQKGIAGPILYIEVADAAAAIAGLVDQGATVKEEPHDVGGGMLIAVLVDSNGNALGLRQPPAAE